MTLTPVNARARERARDRATLLWHAAFFVVVNTFLWVQDIVLGGGVDWAYWTTIPWAAGLALHGLAYYFSIRGLKEPAADHSLVEEQLREMLLR